MLLSVETIEELICKPYKSSTVAASVENTFDTSYDLRWQHSGRYSFEIVHTCNNEFSFMFTICKLIEYFELCDDSFSTNKLPFRTQNWPSRISAQWSYLMRQFFALPGQTMFEKATTEKIRRTESTTKESFNSRDFCLLNCYMVDIFTFFFGHRHA